MPFPSLEDEEEIQEYVYDSERPLEYLDDCPSLPSARGVDFPHVIKTQLIFNELTNPMNLRLCDAVASVLFHYDPNLLSQFLDLSIPEVFFLHEEQSTSLETLVILRKGKKVECGFFNRHGNLLDYGSRIVSTIHDDDRWEATFTDGEQMQFMFKPIDPVQVTITGMRMAQPILIGEKWSTGDDTKIRTTKPEWWSFVTHFGY